MLSAVNACVLSGLEGNIVKVETDLTNGLPTFNIVGLPDASIKESKERVRSAISNSTYDFPMSRITVNLSPASIKKEGSQLDLPIALGILSAMGTCMVKEQEKTCFIGELSLDGSIKYINGVLPMLISLRTLGIETAYVPAESIKEASYIKDMEIYPVGSLNELVDHLNEKKSLLPATKKDYSFSNAHSSYEVDFSEVKGQETLKRAVEIAAAGSHNILIIGSPGSGKTIIARRIPTILPDLTFEESLDITKVYSIAGLNGESGLIQTRPFRAPHHTITRTALVGGGRIPKPGEISLANHGVLFLDELPEFNKSSLEVLRQPLEDGTVTISRANITVDYPSKFMLVSSMNPCPCGYYGDPKHECRCSTSQIERYLSKISGPLLDRIDIQIEATPVEYDDLNSLRKSESSLDIRKRVNRARKIQEDRYVELGIFSNSELGAGQIKKFCNLDLDARNILKTAYDKLSLSARAYNKIIKVSRTIADLDGSKDIKMEHAAEAIQYRNIDKKYWG